MPDLDWNGILDRFEADLDRGETAPESWIEWTPPANPGPLTPVTAERARRVLDRQRDLLARLRSAQERVAQERETLRAPRETVAAAPAYLDLRG